MKSERLVVILLAGAVLCIGALAVFLTYFHDPPRPTTGAEQVGTLTIDAPASNMMPLEAHNRAMRRKERDLTKRLKEAKQVLRAQGVSEDLVVGAIRMLLADTERALDPIDEINLYKWVSELSDKNKAVAFYDEALRDEWVRPDIKGHIMTLLALMDTEASRDALWKHFERIHVAEKLGEERDLRTQMLKMVYAAAASATYPKSEKASQLSARILGAIATSPLEDMPFMARVKAVDFLGIVQNAEARGLLKDLAMGRKTVERSDLEKASDRSAAGDIRKLAAYSLSVTNAPESVKILFNLEENHPDIEVRLAALTGYGVVGSKLPPPWARTFATKRNLPSQELQDRIVARLVEVLERDNENPRIRRRAIRMMARIDTLASTRALAGLLYVEAETLNGLRIGVTLDHRTGANRLGALADTRVHLPEEDPQKKGD